jgi:crotonobetainyl-CoA:carnitine CoA-transferase CaiB-like acyl-CoA transferase
MRSTRSCSLYHRDVHHGPGQVIDLSLFESLFSLLGPLSAEYAALGKTRSRNGSRSKTRVRGDAIGPAMAAGSR